jgi:uncharacterized membrane protein
MVAGAHFGPGVAVTWNYQLNGPVTKIRRGVRIVSTVTVVVGRVSMHEHSVLINDFPLPCAVRSMAARAALFVEVALVVVVVPARLTFAAADTVTVIVDVESG